MNSTFARAMVGAGFFFVAALQASAADAVKLTSAHMPPQMRPAAVALPPGVAPNEQFANPDRAYPPSCLNSPLPLLLYNNDPNAVTGLIKLSGDLFNGANGEASYTESDAVTIFRVPCSGGKSAMLLEIDRPTSVDGNTTNYPVFPLVYVVLSDGTGIVLRTPEDPNTFRSGVVAGVPVYASSVYVIENTYQSSVQFDFNQQISVYVNNLLAASDPDADTQRFDFGAYNPAQYTAASQPLPISGYETGTWYDNAHSGEGIQTEVGELGTAGTQRFVSVSWYTYDSTGTPYWLIGSGVINVSANGVWPNTAAVTLGYSSNGGFAGNFGANATQAVWGTINLSFPDCNTMAFTYATTGTGIPAGVPTGSGSKTWKRLTSVNGLTCQ